MTKVITASTGTTRRDGWAQRLAATAARRALVGVPGLWLLAFVLLPLVVVWLASLTPRGAEGPMGLLAWRDGTATLTLHLAGYARLLADPLYLAACLAGLSQAAAATLLCLLIGLPFALSVVRARRTLRTALLLLVLLPWCVSLLLRVDGWRALLDRQGAVREALAGIGADRLLVALGAIPSPGEWLDSPLAVVLVMVSSYLPMMILPLVRGLSSIDPRLFEAAQDLGASRWFTFRAVTLPLARPGIAAGSMLVFVPCFGEVVIPEWLAGPGTGGPGQALWTEALLRQDLAMAATLAVVILLVAFVPLLVFDRARRELLERRP